MALAAFDSAAKSTLVPNGITSDIYVGLYNDTTQAFVTITGNAKVITTTGTNVGNPPDALRIAVTARLARPFWISTEQPTTAPVGRIS